MGINFGGADRGMPQQFLNHPQIGAPFNQMGCKRMP